MQTWQVCLCGGDKKGRREKGEEFCLFRWRGDAKQQRWSQGAPRVQCGTGGLPCCWGRVICRGSCPALLLALGAGFFFFFSSGSPLLLQSRCLLSAWLQDGICGNAVHRPAPVIASVKCKAGVRFRSRQGSAGGSCDIWCSVR